MKYSTDILFQGIFYIVGRSTDILSQEISQPRLGKRNISEIFYINSRDGRERIQYTVSFYGLTEKSITRINLYLFDH